MLWYSGIAIETGHRNVAKNSYALMFKVPVINFDRVIGTQLLEV